LITTGFGGRQTNPQALDGLLRALFAVFEQDGARGSCYPIKQNHLPLLDGGGLSAEGDFVKVIRPDTWSAFLTLEPQRIAKFLAEALPPKHNRRNRLGYIECYQSQSQ
jgi:hypothetical protein